MEIIFCGTWGRVMCRGKIYMTKRMLMSGGSMPKKWSFLKTRKGLVWLKPSSRKPDMVSDKRGRIFFNRKLRVLAGFKANGEVVVRASKRGDFVIVKAGL